MDEARTLISLDNKSKHMNISWHCEDDVKIRGDAQRVLQVLINLVNNARDASQPDSTISMRAEARGDRVRVSVSDEGIGIPKSIQDRIFDPFFTTKEAGEGTGLGLSLVFSIVEDLHGEIAIISPTNKTKGTGTEVVLHFPRYRDKSQDRADPAAEREASDESI